MGFSTGQHPRGITIISRLWFRGVYKKAVAATIDVLLPFYGGRNRARWIPEIRNENKRAAQLEDGEKSTLVRINDREERKERHGKEELHGRVHVPCSTWRNVRDT